MISLCDTTGERSMHLGCPWCPPHALIVRLDRRPVHLGPRGATEHGFVLPKKHALIGPLKPLMVLLQGDHILLFPIMVVVIAVILVDKRGGGGIDVFSTVSQRNPASFFIFSQLIPSPRCNMSQIQRQELCIVLKTSCLAMWVDCFWIVLRRPSVCIQARRCNASATFPKCIPVELNSLSTNDWCRTSARSFPPLLAASPLAALCQ